MIRGGDFYAIWLEEEGRWSTDEDDVISVVDKAMDDFVEKNRVVLQEKYNCNDIQIRYMWNGDSGSMGVSRILCKFIL